MARPERLELPTPWFEAKCSIQLSYGRLIEADSLSAQTSIGTILLLNHPPVDTVSTEPA